MFFSLCKIWLQFGRKKPSVISWLATLQILKSLKHEERTLIANSVANNVDLKTCTDSLYAVDWSQWLP